MVVIGVTSAAVLLVAIIAGVVFLPEIKKALNFSEPKEVIFTPKEVTIDFGVIDSPAVKQLEPFDELILQDTVGRTDPFIPY